MHHLICFLFLGGISLAVAAGGGNSHLIPQKLRRLNQVSLSPVVTLLPEDQKKSILDRQGACSSEYSKAGFSADGKNFFVAYPSGHFATFNAATGRLETFEKGGFLERQKLARPQKVGEEAVFAEQPAVGLKMESKI
jgi:hypothetical protein